VPCSCCTACTAPHHRRLCPCTPWQDPWGAAHPECSAGRPAAGHAGMPLRKHTVTLPRLTRRALAAHRRPHSRTSLLQGMPLLAGTSTRLRRHGDEVARLPGGYHRALGRADDTMNLGGIKVGFRDQHDVKPAAGIPYLSPANDTKECGQASR
jgi:hypothetical protein